MKISRIIVENKERNYILNDVLKPIHIGTQIDSEIKITGPGNSNFLQVIVTSQKTILKLIHRNASIMVNGNELKDDHILKSKDIVVLYGVMITFEVKGADLIISFDENGSTYFTRAPEFKSKNDDISNEKIIASKFELGKTNQAINTKNTPAKWKIIVTSVFFILTIFSYLIFSAQSLKFEVNPSDIDEISIRGSWFKIPIGERYLLREGSYTAEIKKEGYYPLAHSFEVNESPGQIVSIELKKLPGIINIATNTEDIDQIIIDDTIYLTSSINKLQLEPGYHELTVSSSRFLTYSGSFFVNGMDISENIFIDMIPGWSEIYVDSIPSAAAIYQGNKEIGVTPSSIELLEGIHNISLIKTGFNAWDTILNVKANTKQDIGKIQLVPSNAILKIKTIPSGANISVDGRYRGQSPIDLSLLPEQDYSITFSKNGFNAVDRDIRMNAAEERPITVDLAAVLGKISITLNHGDANVFINGDSVGKGSQDLDLPATEHVLSITKEGYQTFERKINPRVNYPQKIEVNLISNEEFRQKNLKQFIVNSSNQKLRRIEPGDFIMGSSRREVGRRANEVIRNVKITQPFYIGTKEITNSEYRRFREPDNSSADFHPSLIADNNPVVNVSWSDAVEYCNWLSSIEGLQPVYVKRFEKWELLNPIPDGYRLPTEAEWSWAIRYQARKNNTIFSWGNRLPPARDHGNYADIAAKTLLPNIISNYEDGYSSSSPVGSFRSNSLGIYDGSGNVSEWVGDYYSIPVPGSNEIVINPTGPETGINYVIRGSSWRHAGITQLRNAYRDFGNKGRIDVGFRIAKNINE